MNSRIERPLRRLAAGLGVAVVLYPSVEFPIIATGTDRYIAGAVDALGIAGSEAKKGFGDVFSIFEKEQYPPVPLPIFTNTPTTTPTGNKPG